MKKLVMMLMVLVAMGSTTEVSAQSFLKKLGKKIEETAKRKVENKVERTTEKAMDAVLDGKGTSNNNSGNNNNANEVYDNGNGAAQSGQQKGKTAEMSWNKFDFVSGDEIVFEDLLVGEQLGEFPSMWDLMTGNIEIAQIDRENVISLYKTSQIKPLMKEAESYLPESFTIELDFFLYESFNDRLGKGTYQFRLMDGKKDIAYIRFYGHPRNNEIETSVDYISTDGEQKRIDAGAPFIGGGWHKLSISFNKRALKVYIDQTRVANAPNMAQPKWFNVMGDYTDAGGETIFYIKNVRIAKGAVPLYDRMMTDGKIITYGITFDVGKATIKPESMGEINRIVTLMNENPDLKFSVEGHTDSTGNAASNQTLSEQRAQAIVDKLVELGIAKDRLTAVGKGQNNPIADNSTDEGRAKNRRVEFVKM